MKEKNGFHKNLLIALNDETADRLVHLAIERAYFTCGTIIAELLLQLKRIAICKFSEEIRTAALRSEHGRPVLLFNKEFIKECIRTPDCLLFLLLHELMHEAKGDLYMKHKNYAMPYVHKIANLVFDAIINRELIEKYFGFAPQLLEGYKQKEFPVNLLTPPEFLIENRNDIKTIARALIGDSSVMDDSLETPLSNIYSAIWFEKGTYITIYNMLLDLFGESRIPIDVDIIDALLGDHSSRGEIFAELKKKIKDAFPDYSSLHAGYSESLKEVIVSVKERKAVEFYNAVKRAVSPDFRHQYLKEQLLPEKGLITHLGRKEIFLFMRKWYPVFFPNPILQKEYIEWKVHIYIDLSGSTSKYHNIIYGLLLALKDEITYPVYGFSNKVCELKFEDIKNGRIETTGGTDFDCIFSHAMEHKFRRILIVTDGYADLSAELATKAVKDQIEVFVVLTTSCYPIASRFSKMYLKKENMNKTWWVLPKIFC